jgi:hypothetical protein
MARGRAGLDPRRGQPRLMPHHTADGHPEPSTAERRRLVAIGLLRALAATVVVVAAYYLLPPDLAGISLGVVLAVGLLALTVVVAYQVRAIIRHPHSRLNPGWPPLPGLSWWRKGLHPIQTQSAPNDVICHEPAYPGNRPIRRDADDVVPGVTRVPLVRGGGRCSRRGGLGRILRRG